jgi:proteic killer suppression protein
MGSRLPGYPVILSFRDAGSEDIFNGKSSRAARKLLPMDLWRVARRRLDQLDSAAALADVQVPPGNRLEALKGDRNGQHSIRINDQYRICFTWTDNGPTKVEVTD